MVAYALNKTAVENVNKVTDRKIVIINHAIHLKNMTLKYYTQILSMLLQGSTRVGSMGSIEPIDF